MAAAMVSASPVVKLKREEDPDDLMAAFAAGNMSHFLGGPDATKSLEKFARQLGASETEAGDIYNVMRTVVNGV